MTAYLAIALLHQNEAISDRDLTRTAMPLIFAVFLLLAICVLTRAQGSAERFFTIVPLGLLAALVAAWMSSSAWSLDPSEAPVFAIVILAGGGVAALMARALDHTYARWDRRTARERLVRISVAGYRVDGRELLAGLPGQSSSRRRATVSCWTRKDKVYLDGIAIRYLAGRATAGWDRIVAERGVPPSSPTVLISASVTADLMRLVRKPIARLSLLDVQSDEEVRVLELAANDDGLFDITGLGIV